MCISKKINNKHSQKSFDTARKCTTEAIKTASKRPVQRIAEATGDLIGNKNADQITRISKKSVKELPNNDDEDAEITTLKKRYISPEERQQIIDEIRLVPINF